MINDGAHRNSFLWPGGFGNFNPDLYLIMPNFKITDETTIIDTTLLMEPLSSYPWRRPFSSLRPGTRSPRSGVRRHRGNSDIPGWEPVRNSDGLMKPSGPRYASGGVLIIPVERS